MKHPDTSQGTNMETDWHNLYGESWKGLITDEAFAHPAKFSRALIRKIYTHLIEDGLLKPGDTVLDPFGGVALGGHDAMRLGLHWVGCELEAKFHALGNGNIALWRERYTWFPGTATLLNGDSRNLVQVVGAGINGTVSSPPYAGTDPSASHVQGFSRLDPNSPNFRPFAVKSIQDGYNDTREYGSTPGQLGGMKEGDFSAVVTSPPYDQARIDGQGDEGSSGLRNADGSFVRGAAGWELRKAQGGRYGDTDGNLANLPSGDFGAAVSSPPFEQTLGRDVVNAQARREWARANGISNAEHVSPIDMERVGARDQEYGSTPGQLGEMPAGDFGAAISSPPFLQTSGGTNVTSKSGPLADGRLLVRHAAGNAGAGYGQADGQLSSMPDAGFDAAISSPPFGEAQTGGGIAAAKQGKGDYELTTRMPGSIYQVDEQGQTDGQLGVMKMDGFEGAVTSPPYEGSFGKGAMDQQTREERELKAGHKLGGGQIDHPRIYGDDPENIGNTSGDSFWLAARQIVEQVYILLAPGAPAVWVVKDYVRNKQIVPFCDQWRQLCEAVGFETLHIHRAWLVEERGTQLDLMGNAHTKTVERKSFFRRLAEKKGSPRIDWETVICMQKPK